MDTVLHPRIMGFAAVAIIFAWTPVSAQTTDSPATTRPYRGVFAGSTTNPDHSLDVTASSFGGYDENAPVSFGTVPSPLLQSGTYLGFAGTVAYARQGERVQLGANAGSTSRRYFDTGDWIGTSHYGGIGLNARVGQRMRVALNQSVTFAPSYFYGLMPGYEPPALGTVVGGGDFPLGDQGVFVYDTNATANYNFTRRASIEALSTYRFSDLGQNDAALNGLSAYSVGGRYRYGLSRNAALRLGYIYRKGQYAYAVRDMATAIHDIDIGVDYRRALSFSRKTQLDFAVGSSLVTLPTTINSEIGELTYRVVGDVGVSHEIGRTWRARVAYNRGVGFAEAFVQPVFSDAVNLSVTGFFTRRIDFNANAGLAIGDVGLGATGSSSTVPGVSNESFRTWNATARVRFALNSKWAVYGEYLYYSQDFGTAAIVPDGVPPVWDRQTLQFGLTLWFPLSRR